MDEENPESCFEIGDADSPSVGSRVTNNIVRTYTSPSKRVVLPDYRFRTRSRSSRWCTGARQYTSDRNLTAISVKYVKEFDYCRAPVDYRKTNLNLFFDGTVKMKSL